MKRLLCLIAVVLTVCTVQALELPEIFGDNMMLQQQTEAKMWGWAKPGSVVCITNSWNKQKLYRTADKDGKWTVELNTPKASYEPQQITIKGDGETHTIKNILIGEVWFCSGQSNMEMPIRGFWNCPIEGANETIAQAGRYTRSIRMVTIPKIAAEEPADRTLGKWQECTTETIEGFSACGYYFAQTLTDMLDVPVGIINSSWGGSTVEGWMPKEILLTYPDGLTPITDLDMSRRAVMYNGMTYPLAGYTIRGFLWNQGESNVGWNSEYGERFIAMTNHLRSIWGQPNDKLPIYAVEIPPYRYGDSNGTNAAEFRAEQHKIKESLANYGCVCTSDLVYDYEPDQIHAAKKREIGQRLAYMAATRDYGFKGVAAESPEFMKYKKYVANNDDLNAIATATGQKPEEACEVWNLYFSNIADGFDRMMNIQGFEAQDENGNWHTATVWASSTHEEDFVGCILKLSCLEAKEIKNIRYCYHNFVVGKLHNSRGLPVVPFTTEK